MSERANRDREQAHQPAAPHPDMVSLRDYFAAKIMGKCLEEFWSEADGAQRAARAAYEAADAMLVERKRARS